MFCAHDDPLKTVNVKDASRAFDTSKDPLYKRNANLTDDHKVDMKGTGSVAMHFGEHCL